MEMSILSICGADPGIVIAAEPEVREGAGCNVGGDVAESPTFVSMNCKIVALSSLPGPCAMPAI